MQPASAACNAPSFKLLYIISTSADLRLYSQSIKWRGYQYMILYIYEPCNLPTTRV